MRIFSPVAYYQRLYELDIDNLAAAGIKLLLLDADNTITTWNNGEIDPATCQWFAKLKQSSIIGCIISNNSAQRLTSLTVPLQLECEPKARKPLPGGYKRAMERFGVKPAETLMVGDQIFTDVLGANLAGVKSVLLEPISTEFEFKGTRINRQLEKVIKPGVLRRLRRRGNKY